jgi:hypothetical protein
LILEHFQAAATVIVAVARTQDIPSTAISWNIALLAGVGTSELEGVPEGIIEKTIQV